MVNKAFQQWTRLMFISGCDVKIIERLATLPFHSNLIL